MKIKILFPILFLFINTIHAQETTTSILDNAYEQAELEDKNVLIIFNASWCKWCKKLIKVASDLLSNLPGRIKVFIFKYYKKYYARVKEVILDLLSMFFEGIAALPGLF